MDAPTGASRGFLEFEKTNRLTMQVKVEVFSLVVSVVREWTGRSGQKALFWKSRRGKAKGPLEMREMSPTPPHLPSGRARSKWGKNGVDFGIFGESLWRRSMTSVDVRSSRLQGCARRESQGWAPPGKNWHT